MGSFFPTVDEDYKAVSVELTLNSLIKTACFNGSIISDDVLEMDETFTLELTSSTLAVILQPSRSTITITNDDGMTSNSYFMSSMHTSANNCVSLKNNV